MKFCTKRKLIKLTCILALFGYTACDDSATTEDELFAAGESDVEEEFEEMKMTFSYSTIDNSDVKISIMEDNTVVISTEQDIDGFNGMSFDIDAHNDLIEMYKQLTWEKDIPGELVTLNEIFLRNISRLEEIKEPMPAGDYLVSAGTGATGGSGVDIHGAVDINPPSSPTWDPMSAVEFSDRYCGFHGIYDYGRCWFNTTGNTSWQHDHIFDMITWAYFQQGRGYHKIRRKWLGNWKTVEAHGIQAGVVSGIRLVREIDGFPLRTATYKAEVWEGEGDNYHLSIFGFFD